MATEEQTERDSTIELYTGRKTAGQILTISNRKITKLGFWLTQQYDGYSNDIYFKILKTSDNSEITSELWGDYDDVPNVETYCEVTFSNPPTINEEVKILVYMDTPLAGGNGLLVSYKSSDVKANENMCYGDATCNIDNASLDCAYIYTYSTPAFVGSRGYIIGD